MFFPACIVFELCVTWQTHLYHDQDSPETAAAAVPFPEYLMEHLHVVGPGRFSFRAETVSIPVHGQLRVATGKTVLSSSLGYGSPDGWLCATRMLAAWLTTAGQISPADVPRRWTTSLPRFAWPAWSGSWYWARSHKYLLPGSIKKRNTPSKRCYCAHNHHVKLK